MASPRKGNSIYIHVLKSNRGKIVLPGLAAKVVASTSLTGRPVAFHKSANQLTLELSEAVIDPHDTVIKLTLDGLAASIPVVEVSPSPVSVPGSQPDTAGPPRPEVAVYYFRTSGPREVTSSQTRPMG